MMIETTLRAVKRRREDERAKEEHLRAKRIPENTEVGLEESEDAELQAISLRKSLGKRHKTAQAEPKHFNKVITQCKDDCPNNTVICTFEKEAQALQLANQIAKKKLRECKVDLKYIEEKVEKLEQELIAENISPHVKLEKTTSGSEVAFVIEYLRGANSRAKAVIGALRKTLELQKQANRILMEEIDLSKESRGFFPPEAAKTEEKNGSSLNVAQENAQPEHYDQQKLTAANLKGEWDTWAKSPTRSLGRNG
ncbi:hypothetical protein L207DRAFT_630495 [Hyaloscypha variabilis F]|uniref:Uncharacterized protein n=1 Tax=Hyaloscypha variabilis (strain UAMH 11265 / GT02V1 / F) TaxID=1149755 RepID=A0A2J6S027_HYAVF|nr:hypothetical protein L207DRAFT_630495 [Hyaloscypha variabilis F]